MSHDLNSCIVFTLEPGPKTLRNIRAARERSVEMKQWFTQLVKWAFSSAAFSGRHSEPALYWPSNPGLSQPRLPAVGVRAGESLARCLHVCSPVLHTYPCTKNMDTRKHRQAC